MPDRMAGTIVFPTFALELASIRDAVQAEGQSDERAALSDGTTEMTLYEAAWGAFPDLESALVKAGIAFDRHSDAKYEYNAEVRYFRPATEAEPAIDQTVQTLADHTLVVSLDDLQDLGRGRRLSMKAVRAHLGLPRDTVAQWTRRNRRRFRDAMSS